MGYLTDDVTDSLVDRLVREWHKPITPTPRVLREMSGQGLAAALADEADALDHDQGRHPHGWTKCPKCRKERT